MRRSRWEKPRGSLGEAHWRPCGPHDGPKSCRSVCRRASSSARAGHAVRRAQLLAPPPPVHAHHACSDAGVFADDASLQPLVSRTADRPLHACSPIESPAPQDIHPLERGCSAPCVGHYDKHPQRVARARDRRADRRNSTAVRSPRATERRASSYVGGRLWVPVTVRLSRQLLGSPHHRARERHRSLWTSEAGSRARAPSTVARENAIRA